MRILISIIALFSVNVEAQNITCNGNACSISSPMPLGITSNGYLALGPNDESSIFFVSNGRSIAKILPTGKMELFGDPNAILKTADISVGGDSQRLKIGGGLDTDTESGARIMLHSNLAEISPGQLVLQAGRTTALDSQNKGAIAWVGTTEAQPVIVAVEDVPFIRFEPSRRVNFLQQPVKLKQNLKTRRGLEIMVNGESFIIPIYESK